MALYGAKEMEEAFRTVRKNTLVIAEDIPENQYGYTAAPGVKTVGEMLAHLAVSTRWHLGVHGKRVTFLDFATFGENAARAQAEEKALTTKAAIVAALKDDGEAFAAFVGSLSDEALGERVSFPEPLPSKTRFEMLLSAKEHEMHHRGQLMLIERQLGIVPHLTRAREARIAEVMKSQAGAAR